MNTTGITKQQIEDCVQAIKELAQAQREEYDRRHDGPIRVTGERWEVTHQRWRDEEMPALVKILANCQQIYSFVSAPVKDAAVALGLDIKPLQEIDAPFPRASAQVIAEGLRLLEVVKIKGGINREEAEALPVLSTTEGKILDIIKAIGDARGIMGRGLIDQMHRTHNILIDESNLTSRIIPKLKDHGVKSKPKVGYYFDPAGKFS